MSRTVEMIRLFHINDYIGLDIVNKEVGRSTINLPKNGFFPISHRKMGK